MFSDERASSGLVGAGGAHQHLGVEQPLRRLQGAAVDAGGVNVAANCTEGVARIAVGTMRDDSRFATFSPSGAVRDGGLTLVPEEPSLAGIAVAFGTLTDETDPPVQLVTAFSGGPSEDMFQTTIWDYPNNSGPLDAFDAYDAFIRISVAIGVM